MKLLVQRVKSARVEVEGEVTGAIGPGALVFLGVHRNDSHAQIRPLVRRLINLRFFPDDRGKTNLSILDAGGELLVVSQFTLYADCQTGRRPSFMHAASGEQAQALYEAFVLEAKAYVDRVETGRFAAQMEVAQVGAGPFALILED